jgi:hypothetical protein
VDILIYVNGVPHLLGADLGTDGEILEQAAVRPSHHLEVRPRKGCSLSLGPKCRSSNCPFLTAL